MPDFDRITFESWTIAFPADWSDQAQENGSLYFEAPDGSMGFYVALWNMGDEEQRGPAELIQTFQETELENFLPKGEGWALLQRELEDSSATATGLWEVFNEQTSYYVCGRQVAAGKLVLRATFHDYASASPEHSAEFFLPIISSLALRDA